MEESSASRKREVISGVAVLFIIAILVLAITVTNKKKPSSNFVASVNKLTTTSSQSSSSSSTTVYKDGSYTATGSYDSPGGTESIIVSVTLKGGTVTTASAKEGANDPTAQEYQDQFVSGYKNLVVGKPISSIKLSRVSGSSLTSQGFNSALDQIKRQAQS